MKGILLTMEDILFSIVAGIISGWLVSKYFERKNKKQEIENNLDTIIIGLQLLVHLMGRDTEKTKQNSDEINMLITQWKILLRKIQRDAKERGYEEESKIVEDVLCVLDRIAKESEDAKNDFIEIKRRDVVGIWLKLNQVKNKYS